ncbi:unnamed protein product [Paramecium sonneborni]|uniref:WD40-repeat-containing domain n=1 Tax=Paramecium sonneborni TaxID=65129 RepID=A0A8S1PGD8_9CILI|nr:unnamed protein product [Paramecium sonneborni]
MGNQLQQYHQLIFELDESCTFKMSYPCSALAINKNGSLILTNIFSIILLIGFNGKSCKYISEVQKHKNAISILKFLKLRQQFISASSDSIIIWALNHNYGTRNKFIQKLQGHKDLITSLEIHHLNEDLMVSGDYDKRIKIWSMENIYGKQNSTQQWKCIHEIRELKSQVLSLSINNTGNQIIACDRDSFILVIEKSKYENTWFLKQKIDVDQLEGSGVNFIKEDKFIFQSNRNNTLDLYQLKQEGKYIKDDQLQLGNSKQNQMRQTSIFNLEQQILTIKKGNKLFIIRFEENNETKKRNGNNKKFEIKYLQKIVFKTIFFHRAITDDGKYLIIKEGVSKSIQIWKLKKGLEN